MNITVDKQECMGCRVCELACSQKHFGVYNPNLARLRIAATFPLPSAPKMCFQCAKPHCVEACPTGALYRTENMVAFDEEKCVSCGACVEACPLDAIWMSESEEYDKPLKCDLCGGNPECVQLCPKHALSVRG